MWKQQQQRIALKNRQNQQHQRQINNRIQHPICQYCGRKLEPFLLPIFVSSTKLPPPLPTTRAPESPPRRGKKGQKKWAKSSFLCKAFLGFFCLNFEDFQVLSQSLLWVSFSHLLVCCFVCGICAFYPKKREKKESLLWRKYHSRFVLFSCVCWILMMQKSQETHNQNHNAVCVVMTVYSSRTSLPLLASASSGDCCTWSWISVPFFVILVEGIKKFRLFWMSSSHSRRRRFVLSILCSAEEWCWLWWWWEVCRIV